MRGLRLDREKARIIIVEAALYGPARRDFCRFFRIDERVWANTPAAEREEALREALGAITAAARDIVDADQMLSEVAGRALAHDVVMAAKADFEAAERLDAPPAIPDRRSPC